MADYKDYAYSDNADVLKSRVSKSKPNTPTVAPTVKEKPQYKEYGYKNNATSMKGVVNKGQTKNPIGSIVSNVGSQYDPKAVNAFEKSRKGFSGKLNTPVASTTPQKNFIDKTLDTFGSSPAGEEKSLSSAVGDFFRKNGTAIYIPGFEKDPAALARSNYDETAWRNSQRPGQVNPVPNAPRQAGFVPNPDAQFERLGATPRPGAKLGPGLTITQNRFGEVGLFNADGSRTNPSTRLSGGNLGGTPLPAGQQTSFVKNPVAQSMVQNLTTPQPQTGIPGVTAEPGAIPGAMPGGNWTGLMNAETAMLNAVVNPKLKPGQFQDFKGTIGMNPSQPGGDSAFRSIESQIADLTNQNKQLLGGYGQTTDMGRMSQGQRMAMVQKNSETIKALNDSLTGRSTLANDLVKALIGAQTSQQVANTAAGADIAKAGITGEAAVQAADIEAGGKVGAARVTNSADVDAAAKQRGFKAVELRFKELSKKSEQGVLTAEENKEYQSLTETLKAYQLEGEDEDTPLPGMPKFS